jgi:hypothetical protein
VHGLGDDFIDAELIERAQDVEEAYGGLWELAAAGTEHHDLFPFMELDVAVFFLSPQAEEGVALAFLGLKFAWTSEETQRSAWCVV